MWLQQSPAQSTTTAVISMRQLEGTLNKHQMRSRSIGVSHGATFRSGQKTKSKPNNQNNPTKPNPQGFRLTKKGGVQMTNLAILVGQTSRKKPNKPTCRRLFKYIKKIRHVFTCHWKSPFLWSPGNVSFSWALTNNLFFYEKSLNLRIMLLA